MKIQLNENYKQLQESYLFAGIAKKVSAYSQAHPDKKNHPVGDWRCDAAFDAYRDPGFAEGCGRNGGAGDLPGLSAGGRL